MIRERMERQQAELQKQLKFEEVNWNRNFNDVKRIVY